MKKLLSILLSWIVISGLSAQNNNSVNTSAVSESKMQEQRMKEKNLDSIWRTETIWNLGVLDMSRKPFKDLFEIEPPRWAGWDYDLTKYYVSQMKYPEELLKKNIAGYSVVMFSIDTLGLPRSVNILTTKHKDFDKEVIRLTKELPHCLPCRDKNGKRMECLYTVYVPFLPQHYRDRVKKDSIWEEELKHSFVEWESPSRFQDGNPNTIQDYIDEKLEYDPKLLGNKEQARGLYRVKINSYGEVSEVDVFRSCGIQEWDLQVMDIIKGMPRWTPAISYYGKSKYQESIWTMNVFFRKTKGKLIAQTFEKHLETGVPVCFLNEQGDTIVPYGKYKFCQINSVKNLVFAYENKQGARIVCLNSLGKELFYVFQYDNGPDKFQEGLFRIMDENGLIGFADLLGNVVIKPQFKFAFPFEEGKAKVTFSGESKAVSDSKDEIHYWDSSDWYYIDKNGKIDTIILESPGFDLWYTKEMPEKYKDQGFLMWTESKVYREDVSAINVFVTNPTNKMFWMGRDWSLHIWDGTQWSIPPMKSELNVFADAFSKKKAPLLYCFRFPIGEYYHLSKGKYRIGKSFSLHEKDEINLYAEFEIK